MILLFFEELGGISIPVVLTSAIAGQSMTFFSKAAIFYSKALEPSLDPHLHTQQLAKNGIGNISLVSLNNLK